MEKKNTYLTAFPTYFYPCPGHCSTLKNCVIIDIEKLGRKILLLKNEINCLPKVFGLPNEKLKNK